MGSDNIDKKVKKKEKKEKTKLVEEDVAEDASKVKKKKRKELEAEDEAAAPVDDGEKKKKKKKKDKVVEEESEEDVPEKKKKKSTTDEGAVKKGKCRQSRGGDFTFTEHPAIVAMTSKDVLAEREKRGMTVKTGGTNDIKPVTEFIHAGFTSKLEKWMLSQYERPSPIQSQSWPIILNNRDLIGIASTGSGKTLAFGAPGLMMCAKHPVSPGRPIMACVAPTRELALQIAEVLNLAGQCLGIQTAVVFGGMPKWEQVKALKTAHIVVATPGRLQDLMQGGECDLSGVKYMVLDEADRMLDMGFEKDIRNIISTTPSSETRQTLMFSATWPKDAAKLANDFLAKDVMTIQIGSLELSASHTVTQRVEVLEMGARDARLDQLLNKYHDRKNRVLIFVLYKKEAPRLEQTLMRKGWKAVAIHGDMTQEGRLKALEGFKSGTTPMMIATDVAARGLDIPDVEYVINYSFPLTVEDYVHRIGRTGRAGKSGIAHTFFTVADKVRAGELVNVLREAGAEVPPDLLKFGTHVKKKESKLYGAHFKEIDENVKAVKITFGDDSDDE
eukprot:CAMPEP_0198208722 /NCGR_PEP_ID=MMETSP1445-20131203/12069_1 /TAXON_ID=36898 /ORGANISM="Pyramimonas sp., Strain CCMP2087" /LENGTH=557 /DNA_ID=CAMNT_0043882235 /DNA_START=294 /DNA_END=1967 /DNA_ORIENTATION=+